MGHPAQDRNRSTQTRSPRRLAAAQRPAVPPTTTVAEPPPTERTFSPSDYARPDERMYSITHERIVGGDVAEALWESYHESFSPLADLAMLQHLYTRDEILDELANPDIVKIVAWLAGRPVGLGMVTNVLEAVPQISPQFLRAKYPEHAARNTIYFGILVMVAPGLRGRTLFSRIYTELWQVPARAGGVLAFDICEFNRTMFDTDVLTKRIADQFPRSQVNVVDTQTYYVAELPEPLPTMPGSEHRRSSQQQLS